MHLENKTTNKIKQKRASIIGIALFFIALAVSSFVLPNQQRQKDLFNGKDLKNWLTRGDVSVEDSIFVLTGHAQAELRKGNYQSFELKLLLKTQDRGKGYINIHTDRTGKGHRIALNNDLDDPVWWRMTGSLISVRNLTKSLAIDNEWFRLTIRVEGKLVTVSVNERLVVEYIEPQEPFRTGENVNALLSRGGISVSGTGPGSIRIRKISIQELRHDPALIKEQLTSAIDEQTDDIIKLHQQDFPVLDYHIHLKGHYTKQSLAARSRQTGVNYALAPSCGLGYPIHNDEGVISYLDTMRAEPFIVTIQAEGREWVDLFSREVMNRLDFVFADAMTFNDHKGRRTRLFVEKEVMIDDEQEYMDMIVERACEILKEPFEIYVNPFFLPKPMQDRYDQFWTEQRVDKVIGALVKSGKALEINNRYKIPNRSTILKAKATGIKFTFGTNNVTPDIGNMEYAVRMIQECGITSEDVYKPKIKQQM